MVSDLFGRSTGRRGTITKVFYVRNSAPIALWNPVQTKFKSLFNLHSSKIEDPHLHLSRINFRVAWTGDEPFYWTVTVFYRRSCRNPGRDLRVEAAARAGISLLTGAVSWTDCLQRYSLYFSFQDFSAAGMRQFVQCLNASVIFSNFTTRSLLVSFVF